MRPVVPPVQAALLSLVFGIAVGVDQAHGDRFSSCFPAVGPSRVQTFLVQRPDNTPTGAYPLIHLPPQSPFNQRLRGSVEGVVQLRDPETPEFEHVSEPRVVNRAVFAPCSRERHCGDGSPMDDLCQVGWKRPSSSSNSFILQLRLWRSRRVLKRLSWSSTSRSEIAARCL